MTSRSPRVELLVNALRQLFSIHGPKKLLARRSEVPDFLATVLFDESYRGMSWADEANLLRNSMLSLERLSKSTNPRFLPKSITDVLPDMSQDADCTALGELFAHHGSDKSTVSDYHLIYAALLNGKRWTPLDILEIGLGTYHLDTPSNMGRKGVPGASLRGFRDWAPHAHVRGADIDRRILFSEERITTYFVDQNDPESLAELAAKLAPNSLDLFIDDGLHTAQANLNSLCFALPLVRSNGYVVTEDIDQVDLPWWQIAFALLGNSYRCDILRTKSAFAALVKKA